MAELYEDKDIRMPAGYRIYKEEDNRMLGNHEEEFYLSNRSFHEVDKYFLGSVSKEIEHQIEQDPGRQIQVLDVAGGTNSQAVNDIERKFGRKKVRAINIDLAHTAGKDENADRVQANATAIPLADSTIDIVYSRQFLPFVSRFTREHEEKIKEILTEIVRVLKPGGIAFLDDEEELSGPSKESKRNELTMDLKADIDYNYTPLASVKRKFPKMWEKKVRPRQFLTVKKPKLQQK